MTAPFDLPAIVARETAVRDAAADALRSRRRDAAEAVALMAEERRALDALNVAVRGLTRAEQREVVDALRKARDESAAAEPVFPAPPRRDVTVARVEHRTAAPLAIEVDRDHCPRCGALDLDHTVEECARRWAEQHPGAAAGIVGAERAPRESA